MTRSGKGLGAVVWLASVLACVAALGGWAERSVAGPPPCGNGIVTPPETCDPPGSIQAGGAVCRSDCTFCGDRIVNDGEQCEPPNTATCSSTCTNCPGTVCANPRVARAAGCAVLELNGGSVDMTGPAGGVFGDVCIGPNGKLSMSGSQFITGNVRLAPGAQFSNSGSTTAGNVLSNQDLSGEIADANAAASNAAALACTQSFSSLGAGATVTGTGGTNVICVGSVVLQAGQVITVSGGAGDSFVFNVTGKFTINGGRIVASGVQAKDILYNIIGAGEQVAFTGGGGGTGCCKASVDGTLLAVNRDIALSPGLVNGDIISARKISIVSGASVRCPAAPPCPAPGTGGTCASPIVIPATGGTVNGTTSGTSAQSGSCAAESANAPEQVFSWTPSKSGSATVQTCGAGTKFDTVLYVRSGSCAKGSQIACNDDTTACATGDPCASNDHHGSLVTITVTAGQTYFLFVDGFNGSCGGSSGAFALTVTPP